MLMITDEAVAIKREIDGKVFDIQMEEDELEEIYQLIKSEEIEEELCDFVEENLSEEEAGIVRSALATEEKADEIVRHCMEHLEELEKPIKRVIYENELRRLYTR